MRVFHQATKLPIDKNIFISIISGTEAGIATTAAIVAGLLIGTNDRNIVIVSAIIATFVQAFNSAITSTLALKIMDEIEDSKKEASLLRPLAKTAMQFITHIMAGIVVILPVIYVDSLGYSLIYSVAIAMVLLVWIGLAVGFIVHKSPLKYGLESLLTGSLIITGGFIAGLLVS